MRVLNMRTEFILGILAGIFLMALLLQLNIKSSVSGLTFKFQTIYREIYNPYCTNIQ